MEVGDERDAEYGGGGDRPGAAVFVLHGDHGAGVVVCYQHAGAFCGRRIENARDGSDVVEERDGDDDCRRGRSGGDLLHRVVDRAGVEVKGERRGNCRQGHSFL